MSPHTKQLIINLGKQKNISLESDLDNPLQRAIINTRNTIVFDLHGVIFRVSPILVIKSLLKCPQKRCFFKLILNLPFLYDFICTIFCKKVIEEWINLLSEKYSDFAKIKPTAIEIANAQKPVLNMEKILKKLKEKRYTLVIFSNIGEESMSILVKRYPDIFNLFEKIIYSSKNDNYIAKPSPKAFQKLFHQVGHHNFIFVDDTTKNIEQAHKQNIHGILFINSFTFEHTLKRFGIL